MNIEISPDDILDLKEVSQKISESLAMHLEGLPMHLAFSSLSVGLTSLLLSVGNAYGCDGEDIIEMFKLQLDESNRLIKDLWEKN